MGKMETIIDPIKELLPDSCNVELVSKHEDVLLRPKSAPKNGDSLDCNNF